MPRRYFIEALKALGLNPNKLPPKPPDKARRPLQALGFIRHLYAIEHRIREQTPAERLVARQADSVPVLDELRAWLMETLPKVVPGTALGKAWDISTGTGTGSFATARTAAWK